MPCFRVADVALRKLRVTRDVLGVDARKPHIAGVEGSLGRLRRLHAAIKTADRGGHDQTPEHAASADAPRSASRQIASGQAARPCPARDRFGGPATYRVRLRRQIAIGRAVEGMRWGRSSSALPWEVAVGSCREKLP